MEKYIKQAIENHKLRLVAGKKYWRKYFLVISELCWGRNLFDGYLIHVYSEEYGEHLATIKI